MARILFMRVSDSTIAVPEASSSESLLPTSAAKTGGTVRRGRVPVRDETSSSPRAEEAKSAPVVPEAEAWLSDEWLVAWLKTDPPLGREDLGPYFFFARDRLSIRGASAQRLSPSGQEVLSGLLSPSVAVRTNAARRAKDLSMPDVTAVHEALAERVRLAEELDGPESPLPGLFELVKNRTELASEFVALLRSVPASALKSGTPPRVLSTLQGSTGEAIARQLIAEWAAQTANASLAMAAAQILKPRASTSASRR